MSIEGIIREEATEIATRLQKEASQFETQYAELQAKAAEIKTKRDFARAAPDRLLNFQIKIGGDYHCPACWIERNALDRLILIPSQSRDEVFKCVTCGHTITITY